MSLDPEELGRKIKEAQAKETAPAKQPVVGENTAMAKAMRAGVELASAIFVGGFLGYWLDKWLHTTPLFLILLFIAGFIAGFLNLYRSQTGQELKIGFGEIKKPGQEKEKKE